MFLVPGFTTDVVDARATAARLRIYCRRFVRREYISRDTSRKNFKSPSSSAWRFRSVSRVAGGSRARHVQRHEATAAIVTQHGRASRDCVNGVCVQGTVICLRLTRGRRRRRRWLARASMSMRCGLQTLLEAARFVELQEEFEKQQLVTLHAAGNDHTIFIIIILWHDIL